MKAVLMLSTTCLLGSIAPGCSNATEPVAPEGGVESGVGTAARDGSQTPSDAAGEVALEAGSHIGVSCNVTAACGSPLECCSTRGPGALGTCVAPGMCAGIVVACDESSQCALGQACCISTSAVTCEDAGCSAGAYQLCVTPSFSCPSGYSCSLLPHSALPVCMPPDGGTLDAGPDARAD